MSQGSVKVSFGLPIDRLTVNVAWLIKLRWAAVMGQFFTIAFVAWVLRIEIPLLPLFVLLGLTAATNLGLVAFYRARSGQIIASDEETSPWQMIVGLVMLLDLFLLTGLLYFTGGPANPFFVFYFVNLSLVAVVLPGRWAWSLTGLAVLCFAGLFVDHAHVPALETAEGMRTVRESGRFTLVQQGLIAAFATCATVIVYFMTRLTYELRLREVALRKVEAQRARSEKLEALGTLAAGAAHELATPLSTIAVVVGDLHDQAIEFDNPDLREDIALIRSEIARCRRILDHLAVDAGQATGEGLSRVSPSELVQAILAEVADAQRVQVTLEKHKGEVWLQIPKHTVSQALRGLVKNALDASGRSGIVDLSVRVIDETLCLAIADHGAGMSPAVLSRVGEPFFTTKEPGRGTGLGIFLARSVVERIGGKLDIQSLPGQGTTVMIELPMEVAGSEKEKGKRKKE